MNYELNRTSLTFLLLGLLMFSSFIALVSMNTFLKLKKYNTHKTFTLKQIGEVLKEKDHTFIVLNKEYEPGLKGLEDFSEVTVIYWLDRNDDLVKRYILKVHPQGNKDNPLRGVFATHSPVRPNLIAISRCKILSVNKNVIEIDKIDAFDHSPVIDLKN